MSDYIYLIAPLTAWILAQLIKIGLSIRKKGFSLSETWESGGMPSAHTAGIIALLTVIGIRFSVTDPLFAICFTVAGIVIYDAIGVRRTAGENALAIKQIERKLKDHPTVKLHVALGHTPLEVIGGALLGILIGVSLTNAL